jgi:hypothetical protein
MARPESEATTEKTDLPDLPDLPDHKELRAIQVQRATLELLEEMAGTVRMALLASEDLLVQKAILEQGYPLEAKSTRFR